MMQTMDAWQYSPDKCDFCNASGEIVFGDDNILRPDYPSYPKHSSIGCECPPQPIAEIVICENYLIYFFSIEFLVRLFCYDPPEAFIRHLSGWDYLRNWSQGVTEATVILDALAIFPYYIENYDKSNGLLSVRLLRLFRVFQLLRLGQYNATFASLINVFFSSLLSLNILMIVLLFGAAFFGSMIYWLEKGTWKYTNYTDPPSYRFMRLSADGVSEEPSPFTSIPAAFWWFIVTATTVGYGDVYPTSVTGKIVGACAMLLGVLVIAFPVSVFSDLWSKELKKSGALILVEAADDGDDYNKNNDNNKDDVEYVRNHELAGQIHASDADDERYSPLNTSDEDSIKTPRNEDSTLQVLNITPKYVKGTSIPLTIETPTPQVSPAILRSPIIGNPESLGFILLTAEQQSSLWQHLDRIQQSQEEIRAILAGAAPR